MSSCAYVDSVGVGGIDFYNAAVDFEDLAFLVMVQNLQESDRALIDKMQSIRTASERKNTLYRRIELLNQALSECTGDKPDSLVTVDAWAWDPDHPQGDPARKVSRESTGTGVVDKKNPVCPKAVAAYVDSLSEAEREQLMKTGTVDCRTLYEYATGLQEQDYLRRHYEAQSQNPVPDYGISISRNVIQAHVNATHTSMTPAGSGTKTVTREQLQTRLEGLRTELENMNSASEIMMIDLQRIMNKRSESVQLVSNILQKSHQTAMVLLGNLKT